MTARPAEAFACDVLRAGCAASKPLAADAAQAALDAGAPVLGATPVCAMAGRPADEIDDAAPPERPARPEKPLLRPPAEVPRRRLGTEAGRVALLHAVAHIEFNAIDLAFDMAARFSAEIAADGLDADEFLHDWFSVGADEARHFRMIEGRLEALGATYGDLPAHDGLWSAATRTADSVLARLAIAPMVLEARGLDVTPGMIERLKAAGDDESASLLGAIYEEEIGHVRAGAKWFERTCAARGLAPAETFAELVAARFDGVLKPPFNEPARTAAGLPAAYYAHAHTP